MTLSPEAREAVALRDVLARTERRENGLRANMDEVATLAHQMVAIVRRGALRPDPQTGWLEPAPVEPAQPASGGLEAVREAKTALELVRAIIVEAALTGFNCHTGDWAERLYASQADTHAAVKCCTAALAAPATPAGAGGEAVAVGPYLWRLNNAADLLASRGYPDTAEGLREASKVFDSLFTHPGPDTGAGVVKVKALEWVDLSDASIAHTPFRIYKVARAGETVNMFIPGSDLPKSFHATLDEAKAAAQADYETRIRSALEGRSDG